MKKTCLAVVLILLLFALIPAEAQCLIEGSPDDIIEQLKTNAEFYAGLGYKTDDQVNWKACEFEFKDRKTMIFTCTVNKDTKIQVYGKNALTAFGIIVIGKVEDKKPDQSALDWALVAASAACGDLKNDELQDVFLKALAEDYEDETIQMKSGYVTDQPDTWEFIIENK